MIEEVRYNHSFRFYDPDKNRYNYGFVYLGDLAKLKIRSKIGRISVDKNLIEFSEHSDRYPAVIFSFSEKEIDSKVFFILDSLLKSHCDGIVEFDAKNICDVLAYMSISTMNDYWGLVGELLFIMHNVKIGNSDIVQLWHNSPKDNYDFCDGNSVFEIKTTKLSVRRHSLKYFQHNLLVSDFRRNKFYVSFVISDVKPDRNLNSMISEIYDVLGDSLSHVFRNKISNYDPSLFEMEGEFNMDESLASIKFLEVKDLGPFNISVDRVDFKSLVVPVFFD